MKLSLLFVDDEENILKGFKRTLYPMINDWDIYYATSGAEALEILKKEKIEIIISDMQMPGMDGAELLTKVKENYPDIVRIILSGHLDKELVFKSLHPAHQYFTKPLDLESLKSVIVKAHSIKELLEGEEVRSKISKMEKLPSLPKLYQEIMSEMRSKDPTIKKIGEIISQDIAMTAKILQIVNSAFFGIPRHISNLVQAVSLLGIENIKALVLSVQIFSQFQLQNFKGISIEKIWEHSNRVGQMAKCIALEENIQNKILSDNCMLSGFLHDIGKLVLMVNYPKEYQNVIDLTHRERIDFYQSEIKVLGISHPEVGAYLLGLWGIPNDIIEAVAFHHKPSQFENENFNALSSVHIANVLENIESNHDNFLEFDLNHLESIGLINKIDSFKMKCLNIINQGENLE